MVLLILHCLLAVVGLDLFGGLVDLVFLVFARGCRCLVLATSALHSARSLLVKWVDEVGFVASSDQKTAQPVGDHS